MAIGEVGADLDPLPALGEDRLGLLVQLLGDHGFEQGRVLEPPAIVGLEQVAQHLASGFDIVVETHELRPSVGGAHGAFGQHASDFVGLLRIVALQRIPDLFLAFVVGIDREGHELVEGHLLLGIGVEQRGRDRGELQPLLDDAGRDEEHCGDLLFRLALLAHRLEGTELVERMQRRALNILRKAVLFRQTFGAHDAGHGCGLVEAALFHEEFERAVASPARRDLEHAGLGAVFVEEGPDGEAREQRAPRDVLGEFLDRDAGLDLPHVRLAEHQLVEGDVARGAERDLL